MYANEKEPTYKRNLMIVRLKSLRKPSKVGKVVLDQKGVAASTGADVWTAECVGAIQLGFLEVEGNDRSN